MLPIILGAILAIILIIAVYSIIVNEMNRIKMNVPNVSGGMFFFGQVFKMLSGSPWNRFKEWSYQYGQIATFHLFGSNALLVSNPDLLKVILQTKVHIFQKDLQWVYQPFLVILGNGLVTAHGSNWRRQRLLLSSTLRLDILQNIPLMALNAIKRFSKKLDHCCSTGETIEMAEEFRTITLQVIAEAILSLDPLECNTTFAKMYLPIVEEGNLRTWHPERMYLPFLPSYQSHIQHVNKLNNYVVNLINKRWELKQNEKKIAETSAVPSAAAAADSASSLPPPPSSRPYDVLDKVIDAIPNSEWNQEVINQIRDEVKTFILAGHETSASMLTWTLYELTLNHQHIDILRDQAVTLFGPYHGDGSDSIEHINLSSYTHHEITSTLIYADCCLRESLRKYSIVPTVVRVPTEDVQFENILIPKGTSVMINIMGVHHNEDYWPHPNEYRPERFINGENSLKSYTFLPFIDGPRNCLGQYLSLLETKIILSLLVHLYDFELMNKEEGGQSHPYMVPIIPKFGHVMKITKRVK